MCLNRPLRGAVGLWEFVIPDSHPPGLVLEKEIDRQGQQGVVFVFRVVAGHEQEQEQHQQVAGVEIRGQEIPEKGTGWLVFKTSVRLPW